ncbi:MAG: RidA family protein [Acidobacteriaceae bacterium]|nr:RidA family protein [Acidobacteriaceae bacterium]
MILVVLAALPAESLQKGFRSQKRKNEEPKSQVMPLPPQPPMALKADTEELDFHLSPLLQAGGLAAQIRRSLSDLIRDTHGETILKLRAFVAGAGDARRVQAEVSQLFTEHKLPLPVLTVVQVGALGEEAAKVVIEAVVSTHRVVNPNGLAFFAGEYSSSLAKALKQLQESAQAASVAPDRMLTATCLTSRLEDFATVRAGLQAAFPHANVNLVQAVRDPANDNSICQAVGQLSQAPEEGPLVLLKERRIALVSAKQLVFTGLQLSFGSFLDDAHEAFVRLQRAAMAVDPVEVPVEVNVFSLDPSGGSALRKTTSVPPSTFTVQTVEGLPSVDATAGIEAVMAPNVQSTAMR